MIKARNFFHSRRAFLMIFVSAIFLGIAPSLKALFFGRSGQALLCSGRPCNIILIVVDSLSAKHLGLYGYERDTTPFLDEFFGKEGIIFERAWSNAPWTLPSFASLYTSQLPSEVRVGEWTDKLSESIPAFPDELRKRGWRISAFFQGWIKGIKKDWGIAQRFREEERFQVEEQLQFLFAAEKLSQYAEEGDKQPPFFMLIHSFIVHEPYDPPPQYRSLFGGPPVYEEPVPYKELYRVLGSDAERKQQFLRQYDQEIRYLDDLLAEFFGKLPQEILKTTVIIITADHGEAFGEHGFFVHPGPPYEEIAHIPMLIRIPGVSGRRIKYAVSNLDVAPTILDIAGAPIPKSFRGRSLLPLIAGEVKYPERLILTDFIMDPFSNPRDPDFTPKVRRSRLLNGVGARLGNWKVIRISREDIELYNLESDPEEKNNLFDQRATLSPAEKKIVNRLLIAVGAPPLFCENIPKPIQFLCGQIASLLPRR